jgi:hypothetical protein
MSNQDESPPVVFAGLLKQSLLIHAAKCRRAAERDPEVDPELAKIPAPEMPASRFAAAPMWSALHD